MFGHKEKAKSNKYITIAKCFKRDFLSTKQCSWNITQQKITGKCNSENNEPNQTE